MTLSETCIRRPVLTTLITASFLVFGAFAYRLLPSRPLRNPIIRLAGLDPDALYRLVDSERVLTGTGGSNPSGYPGTSTRAAGAEGIALSGKAWAEIGLRLDLGDLESTIIRIQRA